MIRVPKVYGLWLFQADDARQQHLRPPKQHIGHKQNTWIGISRITSLIRYGYSCKMVMLMSFLGTEALQLQCLAVSGFVQIRMPVDSTRNSCECRVQGLGLRVQGLGLSA